MESFPLNKQSMKSNGSVEDVSSFNLETVLFIKILFRNPENVMNRPLYRGRISSIDSISRPLSPIPHQL